MRVPNPTKSVTIDADIDHVKQCVKQLHKIYVDIDMESSETTEDDMMGIYTYRIREFGLNFGVRAVISLSQVGDNQTRIDLEMQRIFGAYDAGAEVQFANDHMLTILQSLSKLLQKKEEELQDFQPTEEEQASNEGNIFSYLIYIFLLAAVTLVYLSRCS